MTSLDSHRPTVVAVVLATVLLGACAGSAATPTPPASSPPVSPPSASSPPVSAGPREPLDVDAVVAGQAALAGMRIAVRGFLLVDADGMRMCSAVLESYPPQCGGGAISVHGTIPDHVRAQLSSTEDEPDLHQAAWGDVVVTGVLTLVEGGTPILDLDTISIVAPA